MNRYKIIGKRAVEDLRPGEEGDLELSAEQERGHLAAKRIEIVPREYEVVGPRTVLGAEPGEKFTAALEVGQEAALVESGHIGRVESKPKASADKEI